MAKILLFESRQKREARLVAGMYDKRRVTQYELYSYCADYYNEKFRGVFSADDEAADEILQNTFIKFWENIESRKIYVEDNVVKGKNGEPLSGSIRTYFMGIARLKFLEWRHEHPQTGDPETEMIRELKKNGFSQKEYLEQMYGDSDNVQLEIIADLISHMSERCCEILTKFYYEEKDLDRILLEIPTIDSKNALKTKKHKCMESLRSSASETYKRYLNN